MRPPDLLSTSSAAGVFPFPSFALLLGNDALLCLSFRSFNVVGGGGDGGGWMSNSFMLQILIVLFLISTIFFNAADVHHNFVFQIASCVIWIAKQKTNLKQVEAQNI